MLVTTDGYFRSGDLGVIDAAGSLRIVGRTRDVIVSGGYKIYPREIEATLDVKVRPATAASPAPVAPQTSKPREQGDPPRQVRHINLNEP